MRTKNVGLISAGTLLVVGAALFVSPHATHGSTRHVHAALASYAAPTINLDNCPTLSEGYHGGCVDQLQTELNSIQGGNLSVDGTFGLATYNAVVAFQQENGLPQDGVVGPVTKQALDNNLSSVATPSPGPAAPTPAPAPSTPPMASVWSPPVVTTGIVTDTIYFNKSQTDYFDSDESQACAIISAVSLPIPGVGEVGELLALGCEAYVKVVELEAMRAEAQGMCLKIKFTTTPFIWWPDIYGGQYCD